MESRPNAGGRASPRTDGNTLLVLSATIFSLSQSNVFIVRGSREPQRSAHSPNLGVDASTNFSKHKSCPIGYCNEKSPKILASISDGGKFKSIGYCNEKSPKILASISDGGKFKSIGVTATKNPQKF